MIVIASILLILAVLVQSPKSGMAANFGAANQTMGVRQTTDFLEKFTWAMIAAIVFFTLLSVATLPAQKSGNDNNGSAEVGVGVEQVYNQDTESTTNDAAVNEESITVEPVTVPTVKETEATEASDKQVTE
jgi:preprotein translocase subunit SecG